MSLWIASVILFGDFCLTFKTLIIIFSIFENLSFMLKSYNWGI